MKAPESFHEEDLQTQRVGAAARKALDALDPFLEQQTLRVEKEVFALIDSGELTPERAKDFWLQIHAAHRFAQNLRKTATRGESAGVRLASSMGA